MKLKKLLIIMGVVMLLNLGICVESVLAADQEDPEPWSISPIITMDIQE